MPELILHHYDLSPFSEKVRLIFGLKQLAWRSVIVPMVLPKPDLMPLTGGFRRTPVLQIGADIYCDTTLIAAELERRFPEPTLFPGAAAGLAAIVSAWADRILFHPTARYVTGVHSGRLPDVFHADRAAMRGHAVPDAATLAAEAPHHRRQLLILLSQVSDMLQDGRPYLLGDRPSLADFSVYARVWWTNALGPTGLTLPPRLDGWVGRIAAIGYGRRTEMTAEEALERASGAEPGDPDAGGDEALAGCRATVTTEGFGPDPVSGEIVFASDQEVALRRDDERVGTVVVHFPRLGYEVVTVSMPTAGEQMDLQRFRDSLDGEAPPTGLGSAIEALWWDAKDDWQKAHGCAQDQNDADGSWVHAYLHRKEGDLDNAAYWYRRAGKPVAVEPLTAEWEAIAVALLPGPRPSAAAAD